MHSGEARDPDKHVQILNITQQGTLRPLTYVSIPVLRRASQQLQRDMRAEHAPPLSRSSSGCWHMLRAQLQASCRSHKVAPRRTGFHRRVLSGSDH